MDVSLHPPERGRSRESRTLVRAIAEADSLRKGQAVDHRHLTTPSVLVDVCRAKLWRVRDPFRNGFDTQTPERFAELPLQDFKHRNIAASLAEADGLERRRM